MFNRFGVYMPTQYSIHGIDVSRYQKDIHWKGVKEMFVDGIKIDFVFMKATQGTNYIDPMFSKNWKSANDHQIAKSAYHFFKPSQDPIEQANLFTQIVHLKSGDLPPVLDIEVSDDMPDSIIKNGAMQWLQVVENFYGVKPIVYTNVNFYKTYFQNILNDYPIWIANYYKTDGPILNKPWLFWQHNDRGLINGIDAFTDLNVFSGDSLQFDSIKIK